MNNDTLRQAQFYHENGLAVYPFETGTKEVKPSEMGFLTWGKYSQISQTAREVDLMFSGRNSNLAIIGGKPSDNAFFIECDDRQQFDNTQNLLAGKGIQTWGQQRDKFIPDDPHAGGGHYYFKAPVPVKTTTANDFGEIRGAGAYVLSDPSIHPTGSRYKLFRQAPRIYRIESLADLSEFGLKPAQSDPPPRIPRKAMSILAGNRKEIAPYLATVRKRSGAVAAAVSSLIWAGYSRAMVYQLFLDYPGTGKFQEMHRDNPANAERWLNLTYNKQNKWLATLDNKPLERALAIERWARSRRWAGRTGSTDYVIFLAHVEIVKRCGKIDDYQASCRELAELAGTHWHTAKNANHRLCDAGLLSLVRPAIAQQANRFCLSVDEAVIQSVSLLEQSSKEFVEECYNKDTLPADHDVFRWAGLNKTGFIIYSALSEMGEASPKELVKATGKGRVTVQKKLAIMSQVGMVERIGYGKYQALEVNLDTVARQPQIATAGKGEAQRDKHLRERRQHKLQLQMGRPK